MNKNEITKWARKAGFERLGTYPSFGEDWVVFTESPEAGVEGGDGMTLVFWWRRDDAIEAKLKERNT